MVVKVSTCQCYQLLLTLLDCLSSYKLNSISDCDCHEPGVIGGIGECDLMSGQCICKPGVESRRCDSCKGGFYGLNGDDLFGCTGKRNDKCPGMLSHDTIYGT